MFPVPPLQDHVAAGPVNTENAHPCPAGTVSPVAEPVAGGGWQVERPAAGNRGERALHTPAGGDDLLVERQASPDQRGESRGGAGVADFPCNAGNGAGTGRTVFRAEEGGEGRGFHPVRCRLTGGVGLKVGDGVGRNPRFGVGALQGQAVGRSVRRDRPAARRADSP